MPDEKYDARLHKELNRNVGLADADIDQIEASIGKEGPLGGETLTILEGIVSCGFGPSIRFFGKEKVIAAVRIACNYLLMLQDRNTLRHLQNKYDELKGQQD